MEKELFKKYEIEINDEQMLLFNNYYNLLIEKNKVMNLTAITERDQVFLKHYLDSVLPLKEIFIFSAPCETISGTRNS